MLSCIRLFGMMKKLSIPSGIEVKIDGKAVSVKGPKGEIKKDFGNPAFNRFISIKAGNGEIEIASTDEGRKTKAMVGTMAAIINKAFTGVTKGYKYTLKIYFVHFPITVEAKKIEGKTEVTVKNFLGERKPRKAMLRDVDVKVSGDSITVSGIDLEKVGQAAARLEQITKISRKDRRIFNDSILISKKEVDG